MDRTVIGVDGCPGGWVAVIWDPSGARHVRVGRDAFHEILAINHDMIAVDMPIGFPDAYGRNADIEARKALRPYGSRVFPVPCREAVHADNYTEAIKINKLRSNGVSIPPVTNAIRPRMQIIDKLMSLDIEAKLREVHPEVSFAAMNGFVPLEHKKKTSAGERQRLDLLKASGFPELDWNKIECSGKMKRDDVIDACAAAWSARRILEKKSRHYPEAEERDGLGLLMRIHA